MLVLTRRPQDGDDQIRVNVGGKIVDIFINKVRGDRVFVGIVADKDCNIVRGELLPENKEVSSE